MASIDLFGYPTTGRRAGSIFDEPPITDRSCTDEGVLLNIDAGVANVENPTVLRSGLGKEELRVIDDRAFNLEY